MFEVSIWTGGYEVFIIDICFDYECKWPGCTMELWRLVYREGYHLQILQWEGGIVVQE